MKVCAVVGLGLSFETRLLVSSFGRFCLEMAVEWRSSLNRGTGFCLSSRRRPGSNFFSQKETVAIWPRPMPGVARRQVSFFCFAKRKKPKKRRPGFVGPLGCPALLSVAGHSQNSGSLSRSRLMLVAVLALKHCSRTSPATLALLGDSHGALRFASR